MRAWCSDLYVTAKRNHSCRKINKSNQDFWLENADTKQPLQHVIGKYRRLIYEMIANYSLEPLSIGYCKNNNNNNNNNNNSSKVVMADIRKRGRASTRI